MKTVRSILDNYAYRVQNYRGRSLLEETTQAIEELCSAVDGLKITCGAHERTSSDSCICDKIDKNEIEYNRALEDVKAMIRR